MWMSVQWHTNRKEKGMKNWYMPNTKSQEEGREYRTHIWRNRDPKHPRSARRHTFTGSRSSVNSKEGKPKTNSFPETSQSNHWKPKTKKKKKKTRRAARGRWLSEGNSVEKTVGFWPRSRKQEGRGTNVFTCSQEWNVNPESVSSKNALQILRQKQDTLRQRKTKRICH